MVGQKHKSIVALAALAGMASPALAQDSDQSIDALITESSPTNAVATARAQTAAGDLLGAAATLERSLLADPNANDSRLLYAATLCRLGDPQGARVEIAKLNRQDFNDSAWQETQSACGGGLARPAPPPDDGGSGVSGEAYAGLAYDRDARGALALQVDYGGTPIQRDDGLSVIAGLSVGLRAPNYATSGGLYGSIAVATKNDISGPRLSYQVGEIRVGLGRERGNFGYAIGGVARHLRLFGDPYVNEFGWQGELLFGNPEAQRVRLRAEAVRQDYAQSYPGSDADGMRFDLSATLETRLAGKGWAAVGLGGEVKNAHRRDFAYIGGRLFGVIQLPVGAHGQYFNLSGTLRRIDFRDNPPFADRRDTRAFARAAYGVPLVTQLFLEAAASYTVRATKLTATAPYYFTGDLADYHSLGGEARLIWKF